MVTLSLPPTPQELRAIAPYLQRANELKNQEPVIAYWCTSCSLLSFHLKSNLKFLPFSPGTYYAAQLGIATKSKDLTARKFLGELLGTLESVKKEIGPNDAIDDENASSAYVESFALKVFNVADTEDRRGQATR